MHLKKKISAQQLGFIFAMFSALIFSLNIPVSKWLLTFVSPYWLASFLYFGAGIGMAIFVLVSKQKTSRDSPLKGSIYWFIAMLVLDIVAPIFFLLGTQLLPGGTVGLLANAELIFTLVFALVLFKEKLSSANWLALSLIISGLIFLNLNWVVSLNSIGQLWIILATWMWGLENNISKKLSFGNPFFVVVVKGIGTGVGTVLISLLFSEPLADWYVVLLALMIGFVIYGGSLIFYVFAQRHLGAAKVQMIQSFAPVVGGIIALVFFKESLLITMIIAYGLILMALGILGVEAYRNESGFTSIHPPKVSKIA